MLGRLAILMAAAVSLGVAATPTGAMAAHGAGGGGHFGGGAAGGGRSFSGGFRFSGHGLPGGYALVNPGVSGRLSAGRGVPGTAPLVGRHVSSDHRFAWIGHRRVVGRHIYGFIPGIGYGYYWYYDDCYVLTDYGWINVCGYY
jgi:hypothetical protein